ncbi:MAG TPA: NADP-dependent malic enzyme [Gemmatimonadaceae bacterium]|jgi:malate dehydrogenase (oxaloacetate-decarboxylating)(NADP+)
MKREEALEYHSRGRPGKIAVVATKPLANQRDLALAYSPGVAEPCLDIEKNPDDAYRYTAKGNLVAVISNGTAVLGLGNIGALAGKPVMEGKGNLFKQFADIDVFDLEIASEDPEEIIRFCQLVEPTLGGINLEDIKAPECFYIEEKLKETMKIPVFHDDQHGTAIISGAALLNAVEIVGKKLDQVKVVFSGAGASAISVAEHYVRLGVDRRNVTLCDRKGVIYAGREKDMEPHKAKFAHETKNRTLADAMVGADVFVGLSAAGACTQDMVKSMGPSPIVFALANPTPEILPDEVKAVRPEAICATGRSDYPNQINNVLCFPFIFRGALDVRATTINEEMKMAATRALAELAREPVPESVAALYGLTKVQYGPDYIIPFPFDPRVLLYVAPAVAWAAIGSGVAKEFIEVEAYREQLEGRLGQSRSVMRGIQMRAHRNPKRVVFPEGEDPKVIRAAHILQEEGIAKPILLGRPAQMQQRLSELGIELGDISVIDPNTAPERELYAEELWNRRKRRGMSRDEAYSVMGRGIYFASQMVNSGDADAVVAGLNKHYPETIRPALEVVGAEPKTGLVAGLYMMVINNRAIFFGDTTVNIDPTAEQLAKIAQSAARLVRTFGIEPRVAMLSFSNFGSVKHPEAAKVAEAVKILRAVEPDLIVDGEMHADTAFDENVLAMRYPFSRLKQAANVLIFPMLSAGNTSYKLLKSLGGATAIGPILVGMNHPVHVLEQGADTQDIVNMAAVAVIDSQNRSR